MAPLVKALERREAFESMVCVTAQHREMLDSVLAVFDIKPDYDLNLMKHGQSLSDITVGALLGIEKVLRRVQPDIVLVHGDTTTTFVGALAAFYQKIKVGHVEAGLRTGNIYSPYPEEMNRRLTTVLADYHFAPTQRNHENLIKSGVAPEKIYITGNTVIDALLSVLEKEYTFENPLLNQIDYSARKVIVLTCHRRENWGKPMEQIFQGIREVVEAHPDVEVIYPVHLNPQIKALADEFMGGVNRIHLIEPLDYQPFANLLSRAHLIITDSGGIQEEAPALGKPILVVREETERPEAVKAGTVKVVGTQTQALVTAVHHLLTDQKAYETMKNAVNPYGEGGSAKVIVDILLKEFSN